MTAKQPDGGDYRPLSVL